MNDIPKKRRKILIILAVVLWLISSAIAFMLIIPILDSIIRIYAAFWADPNPIGQAYFLGASIRQVGVLFLAMLFVVGVIGGAELQARKFNTPSSWQFMFLTYTVELTLFIFTRLF